MDPQPVSNPMPPAQVPTPTPQLVPPPPAKKNFTALWIIVVLLVGIAIGLLINNKSLISGFTVPGLAPTPTPTVIPTPSPTPNPTANWKTYESKIAGYSLKYPPSIPLESMLTSSDCSSCVENLKLTPNPAVGGSSIAVVLVFKDPRIKTIDDYKNVLIKNDSNIINVQDSKVGGENAVSYKLMGGIPPLPIIEYAVVHDNFYYIIRFVNSDETNKDLAGNTNIFNQIISTFAFQGQTPTPTCRPRPACLDATPRCMIPETLDMCPKASPTPATTYTCPPNGYVDCMPILTPEKQVACSADAMTWYKANCPNFKGGAL